MNAFIRGLLEEKISTIETLLKSLESNSSVRQSPDALKTIARLNREFNQAKNQLLKM